MSYSGGWGNRLMLSKSKLTATNRTFPGLWQPRWATLVMVGFLAIAGAIVTGWFAGEGTITKIVRHIEVLQAHPPVWLEVPMVTGTFLLVPTVMLLLALLTVMRVSPRPRSWSRIAVVGILLALTLRYVAWRALSTLNLDRPLNGSFSVLLFVLEMLLLCSGTLQLFLMLRINDRRKEADYLAQSVIEGTFVPAVDVLIPTYDEPENILKRTILGCQALDYPSKEIYILDDTRRPAVADLARRLGCHYLTRPDNRYAKAGNLNAAIARTAGDLIAVFDADFVPTKNFLQRTVGFFQRPDMGLVQTPQSFYNADPIARNLGLEDVLTPEEEVFYRQVQPIRDGAGSVICSGTSFVVRRQALKEAGGFVTDSLSEDYFTGIRLSAQGYHLAYLDEKLSAGLAAETIADHASQRLRWARGTLQAFFIDANPLTIPGLTLLQRLAHLEGLLTWFTSISRVGFLMFPLAYAFLGVIPLRATMDELLYFFVPYTVAQFSTFAWLNGRSRSALLSDIYSLVLAFPLSLTVLRVMVNPFGRGFNVTPKGQARSSYRFNWSLAWPLIVMFVATAFSLWRNLGISMIQGEWQATVSPEAAQTVKGVGLGWVWSSYNLLMIGIALLILLDVPKPDLYEWFNLRRTARLRVGDRTYWGSTTMLSEGGAEIILTQAGVELPETDDVPVELCILEIDLTLSAQISNIGCRDGLPVLRVSFEPLTLSQEKALVEMLFCRPGQWQYRTTPGEVQSVWILLRTLLYPKALFDRDVQVRAISLTQG
ncbi:glycosyltransferase [Altericista sp. CCNU0014]|uniref:glycosyltransferase n=1 Tax=Altericista sp. CCNU0014 TaxID=3082949 RepID=UPI00384B40A4